MDHFQHFHFSEDPFRNDPLEKFYVTTPSQEDALRRVERAVRQARSLVVVVGEVGAGKTLVARKLYEELEEEVFEASMMLVLRTHVDGDWLLTRFASQLGVEDPSSEREALIGQIYERLAIIREDGRHAVLIVDGAQALAHGDTLAEVCALGRLEYEERRLLTTVLVGAEPLERKLASDPLLAHRVEAKVRVRPFTRDEAANYLAQRVQLAGGDPKLLLPGAVAALHQLCDGAPGRMNTLADNAIFEAYSAGRSELTRSDVERAHTDLGWDDLDRDGVGPTPEEMAAPARRPIPRTNPPGAELSFSGHDAQAPLAFDAAEVTARDPGAPDGDLDSELEAVFESAEGGDDAYQTVLMDLDDDSMSRAPDRRPLPPRAAAAPTEIQLQPADVLEPPPKQNDEVDDLFMELLDD